MHDAYIVVRVLDSSIAHIIIFQFFTVNKTVLILNYYYSQKKKTELLLIDWFDGKRRAAVSSNQRKICPRRVTTTKQNHVPEASFFPLHHSPILSPPVSRFSNHHSDVDTTNPFMINTPIHPVPSSLPQRTETPFQSGDSQPAVARAAC